MNMKKCLKTVLVLAAAAVVTGAQALSLADASAKIGDAIANPAVMTSTVKQLSASDQVAFLARVNAAIDALPGSPAEKAANYVKANSAALKGAAKGNLAALLAEVFATVPPEVLTVINERFAADLFNRAANPARPISDEQMATLALKTMEKIQSRTAGVDNAAVRNTFAVLMFLRASGGTPANLKSQLLAQYKDSAARDLAEKDWIPAAMGKGQLKTYEPMLGASDAGEQPPVEMVLSLVGAQVGLALLADLNDAQGKTPMTATAFSTPFNMIPDPIEKSAGMNRIPRTDDPNAPWFGGNNRSEADEADGYWGQKL